MPDYVTPIGQLKKWARAIKRDVLALWIAARNAETPRAARVIAAITAAYALSPIDLIPDFIPVLGYLDDLLIVPLGIMLAVRLIPATMMARYRREAAALRLSPKSVVAAIVVVAIWLAALYGVWAWARS